MRVPKASLVPGARFWIRDHGDWREITLTNTQQTPKGIKVHWVDAEGNPGKGLATVLYAKPGGRD